MTVSPRFAASCKPTGANRPQQNMDDEQNYTLSVDGGDPSSGLQIKADSTLRDVRVNFPVPAEFTFGVPASREKSLLAKDYLPLTLLNSAEVPTATLKPRKLPGPTQAQFDDLKRMFDEQENELDEERVRSERQSRRRRPRCTGSCAARKPRWSRCSGDGASGKSQEGALRNLAVTAESMRAELKTLRTAVKQLRAEGPGASLQNGCLGAEVDQRRHVEAAGAERFGRRKAPRASRGQRREKGAEDAPEASKRSCLREGRAARDPRGQAERQPDRARSSRGSFHRTRHRRRRRARNPPLPSTFSSARLSARPASCSTRAGSCTSGQPPPLVVTPSRREPPRSTTGNLLPDVGTGALPPPQLPQPLQQQPAAAAPAPSAAAPEAAAPAQLSPERFYPRGQTRQAYKGPPAALVASFSGSNLSKIKPRVGTASAGNLPQVGRVAPR